MKQGYEKPGVECIGHLTPQKELLEVSLLHAARVHAEGRDLDLPFTVFQRSSESHGFYYLREGTDLLFNRLWEILGSKKLLKQRERNQN